MCRFCELFGDGGIWYLNPKNYGRRLYRRGAPGKEPSEFGRTYRAAGPNVISLNDAIELANEGRVDKLNELRKKFWQYLGDQRPCVVLPLEDAIKVAELAHPVVAMYCECRFRARGRIEDDESLYSCCGLGVGMLKWERWPERYKGGVNFMHVEEAAEWLTKWNKKGMVHMVMTYGIPYAGGICNCDYPDCMYIRARVDLGISLVKAHYVAIVDYDKCSGCRRCVERCQFGAIKFEVTVDKPNIDMLNCFGCGLCATGCPKGAIYLVGRSTIPVLKEVW